MHAGESSSDGCFRFWWFDLFAFRSFEKGRFWTLNEIVVHRDTDVTGAGSLPSRPESEFASKIEVSSLKERVEAENQCLNSE